MSVTLTGPIAGRTDVDATRFIDYVARYEVNALDLDSNDAILLPVPAGTTVLAVRARVATAFDVATAVVIGDASDADGWLVTGVLDPTSLNAMVTSQGAGVEDGVSGVTVPFGYAKGKHYASAGYIKVDFNGNPTVGKLVVDVVCSGYASKTSDFVNNF